MWLDSCTRVCFCRWDLPTLPPWMILAPWCFKQRKLWAWEKNCLVTNRWGREFNFYWAIVTGKEFSTNPSVWLSAVLSSQSIWINFAKFTLSGWLFLLRWPCERFSWRVGNWLLQVLHRLHSWRQRHWRKACVEDKPCDVFKKHKCYEIETQTEPSNVTLCSHTTGIYRDWFRSLFGNFSWCEL